MHRVLVLLLPLLSTLLVVQPTHAELLRVATEGNYAPFSYVDDSGQLTGFDVEIAQALCQQMQVQCQVQAITWRDLIPRLEDRSVDLIVASMARTPERLQRVDFSDYYYQSHSVFAGLRLAIIEGTIQADYVARHYPRSTLLLVDHQDRAFAKLLRGEADLVLSDSINLLDFLQRPEAADYDFIGSPLLGDALSPKAHIAVRKGDDDLRNRLNRALEEIRLNGIYDRINRQYFPFSVY